MAKTDGYGFEFVRHMKPGQKPATLEVILGNSVGAMAVGETCEWNGAGYLDVCAPDTAHLGVIQGFVTEKGENIFKTNESLGGTLSGDDTYTAASDNITVDKVKAVVVVDDFALFQATADSSLTQAEVGLWFLGLANTNTSSDGVTGAGAAWSVGTQDFQLVELVTIDGTGAAATTQGLFRLGRSQLLNDVTA